MGSEQRQQARVRAWVEEALDGRLQLRPIYLRRRRWTAVPVESADHFDAQDAALIAAAARGATLVAILLDKVKDLTDLRVCFTVPPTPEGLLDFSSECGLFNYALVSEGLEFSIVCTVEDYYVVAGDRDFVTRAVGSSLAEARQRFDAFAANPAWPEPSRGYMTAVADLYRND